MLNQQGIFLTVEEYRKITVTSTNINSYYVNTNITLSAIA